MRLEHVQRTAAQQVRAVLNLLYLPGDVAFGRGAVQLGELRRYLQDLEGQVLGRALDLGYIVWEDEPAGLLPAPEVP
jgi:hypothetical protein